MKKSIVSIGLVFSLIFVFSVVSFAGGMPAAHELSGYEFGKIVSSLEPGGISEHVSMNPMKGKPALHGMTGQEFGKAISSMEPGTISEHVK